MKTHILYVEDCTPKYKLFASLKKANKWVESFKACTKCNDSWIEAIIEGELILLDETRK